MLKTNKRIKKVVLFLVMAMTMVLTFGTALAHSQNPERDATGTPHQAQTYNRSHRADGLEEGHLPLNNNRHNVDHFQDGHDEELKLPEPTVQFFVAELSGSEEMPVEPESETEALGEPIETESAEGIALFKLVTRQELDESSGERVDVSVVYYRLFVRNITDVTAAHIHVGQPGENGEAVAFLFSGDPTGQFSGLLAEGTITEAELIGSLSNDMIGLTDLLQSGSLYVNVHTVENPDGEIRGQISAQ